MPDFKSFGSAFKGSSRAPMLVYYFNMVWFGVGCGIFTEQMIEFYTPGTMATMGAATNMIYWIMGNAGKVILLNIFVSTFIFQGFGIGGKIASNEISGESNSSLGEGRGEESEDNVVVRLGVSTGEPFAFKLFNRAGSPSLDKRSDTSFRSRRKS